jgi:heme/copper-type cytochrome/quinol oxidase subunit 1
MMNQQPTTETVNVISALGAFIACTTLLLLILTIYMSWRVYIKNKKLILPKGQ